MCQIILAQRNQDAVIGARKIEALGNAVIRINLGFQRFRWAILNEISQVFDELSGAFAARIIGLRERKNLFELIED